MTSEEIVKSLTDCTKQLDCAKDHLIEIQLKSQASNLNSDIGKVIHELKEAIDQVLKIERKYLKA